MINIEKAKSLLTPSANTVLKEMVEQYEIELLEKAYKESIDSSGIVSEITVKDLLKSSNYEVNKNTRIESKKSVIINLGISVSLLYSFIGLVFFLYKEYGNRFYREGNIGLVLFVAGLFIAIMFFISGNLLKSMRLYKNSIKSIRENYEIDFIKKWSELEGITRNWLSTKKGESSSNISIREILNLINKEYINTPSDYKKLNNALNYRNKILHENYKVKNDELNHYIIFLDSLIKKINNTI